MKKVYFSFLLLVISLFFLIVFLKLDFETKYHDFRYKKDYIKSTINWQQFLQEIQILVEKEFPGGNFKGSIYQVKDITGDNIPEVLVETGRGGASTISLTLFQIENNKPKISYFRLKNGSIEKLEFIVGSGGAGRYGFEIETNSYEKLIYYISYTAYNEESDFCNVDAYVWNDKENIFEYDEKLSQKYKEISCKNICKSYKENSELKNYFQRICKDYWK